jgi:hypothetical protein
VLQICNFVSLNLEDFVMYTIYIVRLESFSFNLLFCIKLIYFLLVMVTVLIPSPFEGNLPSTCQYLLYNSNYAGLN